MRSHDTRAAWAVFLACFLVLGASESVFVGADRCRLCHRSVYVRWKATAHSRATESLDIEKDTPSCLPCHTTGPARLPGVQCEACHGAGGNYWPAAIMIDPAKSKEAGLVTPDETTCRRCHGRGLPDHDDRFEMPQGADLLTAVH